MLGVTTALGVNTAPGVVIVLGVTTALGVITALGVTIALGVITAGGSSPFFLLITLISFCKSVALPS